ncbi:glycosyltransferase [Catellatospora paridis]|uniref:glycosyltransferase n=1 Tax=Catellatospora paridis TaxID=1617086 RepID=UPI001E556C6C|nr:glycosyltransferase [Catellatospora paridis]
MHFTDTYLPRRDGVVTSLRTLRAAQAAAGHDVHCVVPAHKDQQDEPGLLRVPALACGVADLRLARWALCARSTREQLVADLAAYRPDVVHVHTPGPAGLLGVLLAARLGVPLVQTYHTDLHAYAEAYRVPGWALRLLLRLYAGRLGVPAALRGDRAAVLSEGNRLLLGDARAVVVPTRAVLDRVALPVPAQRMALIPTGVAERPASRAEAGAFRAGHGIGPKDPVVLFVGRVNREKGVDLLVPAFARVLAATPRARLVLVGAVYERRWLARLLRAAGPGVADRVVLTGQQPPHVVAAAYAAADVFAFPSRTDTQALVLQEAALAGLPAVLADPSLHRYGTLDGNAVLAEPDPAAFGDAVLKLLTDRRAARRLGAAARACAAGHTPQRYAEAMCAVYTAAHAPVRTAVATPDPVAHAALAPAPVIPAGPAPAPLGPALGPLVPAALVPDAPGRAVHVADALVAAAQGVDDRVRLAAHGAG